MQHKKFKDYKLDELDLLAWNAMCHWSKQSGFNNVINNLDFAELTRSFLWTKVGKAIRNKTRSSPEEYGFEESLIKTIKQHRYSKQFDPSRLLQRLSVLNPLTYIKQQRINHESLKKLKECQGNNRPILYIPIPSTRLSSLIADLKSSRSYNLMVKKNIHLHSYKDLSVAPEIKKRKLFDPNLAQQLYQAIVKGLAAYDIALLGEDAKQLKREIRFQINLIETIEEELKTYKPQLILLHADNHSPYQEYVFMARIHHIPTLMLQHGLDAEHYVLEEAYAEAIAVWGKNRAQRYLNNSSFKPKFLEITGNPEYEQIQVNKNIHTKGQYLLWCTRPHIPDKCYLPSRKPMEGIQILLTLVEYLKTHQDEHLVIKIHPYDYKSEYIKCIQQHNMQGQIKFNDDSVLNLIAQSKTVLTEDTTCGLEAMLGGKIVVHIHFSTSKPSLPFVDYHAALPAFSPQQLKNTLDKITTISEQELIKIKQAQDEFIRDFAGPCDGQSSQRTIELIEKILREYKK